MKTQEPTGTTLQNVCMICNVPLRELDIHDSFRGMPILYCPGKPYLEHIHLEGLLKAICEYQKDLDFASQTEGVDISILPSEDLCTIRDPVRARDRRLRADIEVARKNRAEYQAQKERIEKEFALLRKRFQGIFGVPNRPYREVMPSYSGISLPSLSDFQNQTTRGGRTQVL